MSDKPLAAQIAEIACNYNVSEFIGGQKDCRDGVPHKAGMSEGYDRGYGCQYELEQIAGANRAN